MGHHITEEGRFLSDKYPEIGPDKILLSFKDPEAKRALMILAEDYDKKDADLSDDIRTRLKSLEEENNG